MTKIQKSLAVIADKLWEWMECLLHFVLIRVLHIRALEQKWADFLQFVKFCIVGVSNTVLGYVIYLVVVVALRPFSLSWDYIAGNLTEYFLSVLWSFYWNERFVFKLKQGEHRSMWKALLKTYATYAFTGIFLNNALGFLWINKLGLSKYIAPIISLLVSVPLNFIISKLWAFRAKKSISYK